MILAAFESRGPEHRRGGRGTGGGRGYSRARSRGASSWSTRSDGTKEFVARNGEFTVNIALIEDGQPVLGVVYLPALDEMYAGHGNRDPPPRPGGGGARMRAPGALPRRAVPS